MSTSSAVTTAVSSTSSSVAALLAEQRLQQQKTDTSADAASTSPEASAVVVDLSPAAKGVLAGNQPAAPVAPSTNAAVASKAVDSLLSSNGASIYQTAITSLKQYPPDLASQLDSKEISESDRTKIQNAMNAREQAAYGAASRSGDGVAYAKAYVAFYDSLSPAEQNSSRYRGTRESVAAYGASEAARTGQADPKLEENQDPILQLFEDIKANNSDISDKDAKSLIQQYKDDISNLQTSKDDPSGTADKVGAAAARFHAVQSVIGQARAGDSAAFNQLKTLASDPNAIDAFLSYAETAGSIYRGLTDTSSSHRLPAG